MSEGEAATPIDAYLDEGDLTAEAWSRALAEDVLLGQQCQACGHATAAPKAACARCGERDLVVIELPAQGEVYSETTITVPPAGFEGPYQVAVISLGDDEARVLARLETEVAIGDAVELQGSLNVGDRPSPLFG